MRITFERRRSDFERDARVTPFTGSCCCCCCCLHWIGAAVGGIVGMRMGWTAGEKNLGAPLPSEGRTRTRDLTIGIAASIGLFIGAMACVSGSGLLRTSGEIYLVALALAPPVALLPVCAPMLISAYGMRRKMLAAYKADIAKLPPRDGVAATMSLYRAKLTPAPKTHSTMVQFSVFCRHCWFDLGESMHLTRCPECSQEIGQPVISGPDYGVGLAWRASLTSLGVATGGTLIGYVLMLVISMFIR
jgi:hypothetical protein